MEVGDRERLSPDKGSGKAEEKAADVVNDFKAVVMNLPSLITPSYFPSTHGSRSVGASHGPFGSSWIVLTGNVQ